MVVIPYLSVDLRVKGLFVGESAAAQDTCIVRQADVLSCLRFRANELLMMEVWIPRKDCEELVLYGGTLRLGNTAISGGM